MTRYFFDVHDGFHVVDHVGQEMPDIAAAKETAMRRAIAYVAEPKMLRADGGTLVVVIRTDADSVTATLRLAFSIADGGKALPSGQR
ncbi:hypothetical protein HCU64_24930 [Methylobacterium sp. C25]|uniref:DUF6894 family protein n=1 Tax=Methylobacterium sp. C25 TaxID=2721622 RepID=UPI001F48E56E|nr:hypothetical protein [Methylobacterium sp. C25]MCE4226984.1 hypothetical protein [Methylobacterium sp. C25]